VRAWGRLYKPDGSYVWVASVTDPITGDNSAVYITNLIQVLKLNRNESPFFANYGIPSQPSAVTQIAPDVYVWMTQAQFAPYFASLIISRLPNAVPPAPPNPTYSVQLTTLAGVMINFAVVS
jgi:hypothetical protein